ncbi:MAG: hypothetical protein VX593_03370, partial [Pseudomonadota bacterium]|nr:hypothetical protein [Pseudomonadota bacterium]
MISGHDHHDDIAVQRGWLIVRWILIQLTTLMRRADHASGAGTVRLTALRLLRPAEAIARRLFVLMASKYPRLPAPARRPAARRRRKAHRPQTNADRQPAFRLIEPIPDPTKRTSGNARAIPNLCRKPPPLAQQAKNSRGLASLELRIAALAHAFENQSHYIRNTLRWTVSRRRFGRYMPVR